jgi:hypothetical protein
MKKRFLLPLAAGIMALGALLVMHPRNAGAVPLSVLPHVEAGGGLGSDEILVGTRRGLYSLSLFDLAPQARWLGGEVRKIFRPAGSEGWFFLTSKGIFFSADLVTFVERNEGLPFKTYKRLDGATKRFEREVADLKDLEGDGSGRSLVTCTKDEVWLSHDAGLSWTSLGSPVFTTGLKAVALAPMPGTGEAAVWVSHPIKGLFARRLAAASTWVPVTKGLFVLPTMTSPEEVADLVYVEGPKNGVASTSGSAGNPRSNGTLWASNSFQGRLYRAVPGFSEFTELFDDGRDFGTIESLCPLPDGSIRFVEEGRVARLSTAALSSKGEAGKAGVATHNATALDSTAMDEVTTDSSANALVHAAFKALEGAGVLATAWNEGGGSPSLSELWLLDPEPLASLRKEAANHRAIYLQAGYVVNPAYRAKYFKVIEDKGLDAIVVDLKDDFGRLRFSPRDALVRKLGKTSSPMDVEAFVAEAKARNVWLVARIPVFKDESLSIASGGKYAVWDSVNNRAWLGWRTVRKDAATAATEPVESGIASVAPPATSPAEAATERVVYGERWVDPYSEEVWSYNVAIANEIISRGFDEVQFDYIRFPTDGENLSDASYRWRDPGMDKESALSSFLAFARDRISAPISIDIYGANGWYRSGARTGQDVELLARYVDVICPMLYPSHFEQTFLAQEPLVDRPWRIYRFGSLRNALIARNRVIVRPYVQAFYLNVSYDRTWYGPAYVEREVAGVVDGQNLGMTFWNNVARYEDLPVFSPAGRPIPAAASRSPVPIVPAASRPGQDPSEAPTEGILN